jgi:hypothetical protein
MILVTLIKAYQTNYLQIELENDKSTKPFDSVDIESYDKFADEKAHLLLCYSILSILVTLALKHRYWYIAEDRYQEVVGTKRSGFIAQPTSK